MFNELPIELKSKIMYSGFIKHPVSIIFNDFLNDYCDLMHNSFCLEMITYKQEFLYQYLQDTYFLRDYENILYNDILRHYE